jgi:hypothetical protein
VQVRLKNGVAVVLTEAQLIKGVRFELSDGEHFLKLRNGLIEDRFSKKGASDPVVHKPQIEAAEDGRIGRAALRPKHADPSPAVKAARELVEKLDAEIKKLEKRNAAKVDEIDELVLHINDRIDVISWRRMLTAFIGFGFNLGPMVGLSSMIQMRKMDRRLDQLCAELEGVEKLQNGVEDELARYAAQRAAAQLALDQLRKTEDDIARASQVSEDLPKPIQKVLHGIHRLRNEGALVENLNAQIKILTSLRDAAEKLGIHLDDLIAELKKAAKKADQAAKASLQDLFALVKIAVNPNPDQAARDFLDGELKKPIEDRLNKQITKMLADAKVTGKAADFVRQKMVGAIMGSLGRIVPNSPPRRAPVEPPPPPADKRTARRARKGADGEAQAYGGDPTLRKRGGRVLEHPSVKPVYWGNYFETQRGQREMRFNNRFLEYLPESSVNGILAQYGSKAAEYAGWMSFQGTPPFRVREDQLRRIVLDARRYDDHPDPERIYQVVLPPGRKLANPNGTVMKGTGGYHGNFFRMNGEPVYYEVVTDVINFDGRRLDALTVVGDHETEEASTDPDVEHGRQAWTTDQGDEIGDIGMKIVQSLPDVIRRENGFAFQKEWSNKDKRLV